MAHSFGGLVAWAYLEAGGQVARDRVSWLITLRVPHKGMLKTFQAVYSGIKAFTFSAAQTKSTSRGFPSAYELLPTDPADGLFRSAQPGQSPFDDPSWSRPAPEDSWRFPPPAAASFSVIMRTREGSLDEPRGFALTASSSP